MATIKSNYTEGSDYINEKKITVQDSKEQAGGKGFMLSLKEFLGFLFAFFGAGLLLGFIVTFLFFHGHS